MNGNAPESNIITLFSNGCVSFVEVLDPDRYFTHQVSRVKSCRVQLLANLTEAVLV